MARAADPGAIPPRSVHRRATGVNGYTSRPPAWLLAPARNPYAREARYEVVGVPPLPVSGVGAPDGR